MVFGGAGPGVPRLDDAELISSGNSTPIKSTGAMA